MSVVSLLKSTASNCLFSSLCIFALASTAMPVKAAPLPKDRPRVTQDLRETKGDFKLFLTVERLEVGGNWGSVRAIELHPADNQAAIPVQVKDCDSLYVVGDFNVACHQMLVGHLSNQMPIEGDARMEKFEARFYYGEIRDNPSNATAPVTLTTLPFKL